MTIETSKQNTTTWTCDICGKTTELRVMPIGWTEIVRRNASLTGTIRQSQIVCYDHQVSITPVADQDRVVKLHGGPFDGLTEKNPPGEWIIKQLHLYTKVQDFYVEAQAYYEYTTAADAKFIGLKFYTKSGWSDLLDVKVHIYFGDQI